MLEDNIVLRKRIKLKLPPQEIEFDTKLALALHLYELKETERQTIDL
jgi:hypothetical protein